MTYLPGHDGKVTSYNKSISISQQGYKGGNRNYWSYFSVTFETTCKFLIVFARLISGKKGLKGFTGSRRESDNRYKFELKVLLNGLRCNKDSLIYF